jgi:hypothetical protein
VAKRSPDEIIRLAEAHETRTDALRMRMDEDYSRWRLDEFKDAGEGYRTYTSNEPRTYAEKLISWLVESKMMLRIPHADRQRHERDIDQEKERFILGALRSADERLLNILQPTIRDQVAWHICVRGWSAGRALLVKRGDRTYVDVAPFDVRNLTWGMGPDGLEWACYKTRKTREEIEAAYDVEIPSGRPVGEDDTIDVYDFYDKTDNAVVMQDQELKASTPHGSERVPIWLRMVGTQPMIQTESIDDAIADFGESVFSNDRDVYDKHNFAMSVLLELSARARKQVVAITSRDGTKTLAEDPFKEGAEISLSEGERLDVIPMMETSREMGAYMGLISGDLQRGSLPHSVYGDIQFQLSGFAITTLRQGIESILVPRIDAMTQVYTQITNLLIDQYSSGSYEAMELSGNDMNRDYFSHEISPEFVRAGCDPEIHFVAQLPEDDMLKFQMAQIGRGGPTPLLSDKYIRDKTLGLQDAEGEEDTIKEQLAEHTLPEAMLYTLMTAAENRGRSDLAQFYFKQLMMLVMQQQGGMMPPGQDGQPAQPMNGGGAPNGANPQVRPNRGGQPNPAGPENQGPEGPVAPTADINITGLPV